MKGISALSPLNSSFQERERRIRLEKELVDRHLGDATAFRQADEIRAYVKAVSTRRSQEKGALNAGELENWAEWAVAQANRIAPVRSGRFLESIKGTDDEQEAENS